MTGIIDSHCHLQDEKLLPRIADVIARAQAAGVSRFLSCGTQPGDWAALRTLAEKNASITPAFGVHPWYVHGLPGGWETELRDIIASTHSAVGEIGLDLAVPDADRVLQTDVFLRQLAIAHELDRPVSMHVRRAWDVLPEIIAEHAKDIPVIIHSCSASAEIVRMLPANVYCSFSGTLTYSRNRRAHDAVRAVREDRLLIESDAPDLPPCINGVVTRDEPNEPANIVHTLAAVALLRGVSIDAAADVLRANTERALARIR